MSDLYMSDNISYEDVQNTISKVYQQGRTDAFEEIAYSDNVKKEEFEILAYNKGRADKYQEIISEYMLLTENQVAEIRTDVIDEVLEIIRNCFGYSTSEMIRRVEALKEQNNG